MDRTYIVQLRFELTNELDIEMSGFIEKELKGIFSEKLEAIKINNSFDKDVTVDDKKNIVLKISMKSESNDKFIETIMNYILLFEMSFFAFNKKFSTKLIIASRPHIESLNVTKTEKLQTSPVH